jgi:hypothetical protein
LTAGSDDSPTGNYVYILETDVNALVVDTSDWPAEEHIKVCYVLVPSAAHVEAQGAYIVQNWNDHRAGTNLQGHLSHITETIRLTMGGAYWHSGVSPNGDTAGYLTIVDNTPDEMYIKATSGLVYQMHKHTIPAFDSSGPDDFHVVNSSTSDYRELSNLGLEVEDSEGGSLSGKYYNVVLWGVANKTSEYTPMMINMPSGSYNTLAGALADSSGYDNYSIPREFRQESTTGYLVCRMTIRNNTAGGGTFTLEDTVDLRGDTPRTVGSGGGGGGGGTTFADNAFNVYNVSDITKIVDFDLSNIATGTTRTIEMPNGDMIIPTGTVAGATELNYAGAKVFETINGGFDIYDSSGNEGQCIVESGGLILRSRVHGGPIILTGEDQAGAVKTLMHADPDGVFRIYHNGSEMIETGADGIYLHNGAMSFRNTGGKTYFRSHPHGDEIRIEAESTEGVNRQLFIGDPDGAVELYFAGGKTFETVGAGVDIFDSDGDDTVVSWKDSSGTVMSSIYSKTEQTDYRIGPANATAMSAAVGGAVKLYYAGVKAFDTMAEGIAIFDAGLEKIWIYSSSNSQKIHSLPAGEILELWAQNDSNSSKRLFRGDPDGAVALYYAGTLVSETLFDGIKIGDGTNKTELQVSANGFFITNVVHGSPVTIRSEDTGGDAQKLFVGDPDGAVELYYAGFKSFQTLTNGISISDSASNTATFHTDGGNWFLSHTTLGLPWVMQGKNSSNSTKTVFKGDPDGAAELYFAGVKTLETGTNSITIFDTSGGAVIGYAGLSLFLRNTDLAGPVNLQATKADTTLVDVFSGDPDGAAELYYAGVKVLETKVEGFVINDVSNESFEMFYSSDKMVFKNVNISGEMSFKAVDSTGLASNNMLLMNPDGAAELYYAGVKNFWTTSEGAETRGGIKFPATQIASADINTLDDYKEGTWTPVPADAVSGGNTGSAATALGTYTKIGRLVTASCKLININTSGLTAGNAFYIQGLPFTAQSAVDVNYYGSALTANVTFTDSVVSLVSDGDASVKLFDIISAGNSGVLIVSDVLGSNSNVFFTIQYEV